MVSQYNGRNFIGLFLREFPTGAETNNNGPKFPHVASQPQFRSELASKDSKTRLCLSLDGSDVAVVIPVALPAMLECAWFRFTVV
eukprot:scaffold5357_cov208-Amphora_coffeaeformis.AAC.20